MTPSQLILPNRYRLGDYVATMLLRGLVARQMGAPSLRWHYDYPGPFGDVLEPLVSPEDRWMLGVVDEQIADGAGVFDDVNLWMWNDVFLKLGHRVNLAPTAGYPLPKHIVFAPLLEADYSAERCMHPRFVQTLIAELKSRYGNRLVVVLPERPSLHDQHMLKGTGAQLYRGTLEEAVGLIGDVGLFIGGDTGLSHVAGMFPGLRQIALHDRVNTERHVERAYDHAKEHRERIAAICQGLGVTGIDPEAIEYRSFPNKASDRCRCLTFDHGGMDGRTLGAVVETVDEFMEVR